MVAPGRPLWIACSFRVMAAEDLCEPLHSVVESREGIRHLSDILDLTPNPSRTQRVDMDPQAAAPTIHHRSKGGEATGGAECGLLACRERVSGHWPTPGCLNVICHECRSYDARPQRP